MQFGIQIKDSHLSQFELYYRELRDWNQKINLTAIRDLEGIAVKHFLDSLACALAFRPGGSIALDLGSGAGFPGLPLKILFHDLDLTLLEPSSKKIAFLRHLIGTLGLPGVAAVPARIEEFAQDPHYQKRFSHILSRAVNVGDLAPTMLPVLRDAGRVILSRSQPLEKNSRLGSLTVSDNIEYVLPLGYGPRTLTIMEAAA